MPRTCSTCTGTRIPAPDQSLISINIDFGLDAGEELEVRTTICSEIRGNGAAGFIDDVASEPRWRTHDTPIMYGFKSYISVPIVRADGSFFGTLCAIDPAPRETSLIIVCGIIEGFARTIANELDALSADFAVSRSARASRRAGRPAPSSPRRRGRHNVPAA